MAAFYIVYFIGSLTIMTYLVAYLTEIGLLPVESGVGYSMFMLSMLFGQYLWGILSDHISRKYIITICLTLLAMFTWGLLVFNMGQTITYAIVCFMGIASGVIPVMFAIVADCFEPKVAGTASGIVIFIGALGNIFGPLIAGSLATMTGTLATALQVSIVMAVICAVISLTLRYRPKRAT
ncbi:MAG: MFS transporter [Promethearchaeota archaeon]